MSEPTNPENDPNLVKVWDDIKPDDVAAITQAIATIAALRPEVREQTLKALRALFVAPRPHPIQETAQQLLDILVPILPQYFAAISAQREPTSDPTSIGSVHSNTEGLLVKVGDELFLIPHGDIDQYEVGNEPTRQHLERALRTTLREAPESE